mmetsp:Transcript_23989/g.57297  ORF Transcript_23989/g.57297 Transcript_23989/m.57297 type:complete len:235 (+) Transcript_23989:679-1383(+)
MLPVGANHRWSRIDSVCNRGAVAENELDRVLHHVEGAGGEAVLPGDAVQLMVHQGHDVHAPRLVAGGVAVREEHQAARGLELDEGSVPPDDEVAHHTLEGQGRVVPTEAIARVRLRDDRVRLKAVGGRRSCLCSVAAVRVAPYFRLDHCGASDHDAERNVLRGERVLHARQVGGHLEGANSARVHLDLHGGWQRLPVARGLHLHGVVPIRGPQIREAVGWRCRWVRRRRRRRGR